MRPRAPTQTARAANEVDSDETTTEGDANAIDANGRTKSHGSKRVMSKGPRRKAVAGALKIVL
jgi:hypothetical protein